MRWSAVLLFALAVPAAAEVEVPPDLPDPVEPSWVFDVPTLDLAGPDTELAFWGGVRGRPGEGLLFLSAEVGGRLSFRKGDLNEDGFQEFSAGDHAPLMLSRNYLGFRLWEKSKERYFFWSSSIVKVDKYGERHVKANGRLRDVWAAYLVTGLSPALVNDFVMAVPVGIRIEKRQLGPKIGYFEESWFQVTAAMYVPALRAGVDAELFWKPATFGIGIFAEFVPQLDSFDPTALVCRIDDCDFIVPPNAYNPQPAASALRIGIRIRSGYPIK